MTTTEPTLDTPLTVTLTRDDLRLIGEALHAFLDDFSHDQPEVIAAIRRTLGKIVEARTLHPTG